MNLCSASVYRLPRGGGSCKYPWPWVGKEARTMRACSLSLKHRKSTLPTLVELKLRMVGMRRGFNDNNENPESIDRFLVLPQEDLLVHTSLLTTRELKIDYNRCHILISDEFVAFLEAKIACKQALIQEVEMHRVAAEENKEVCKLEKLQREKRSRLRAEECASNKRNKQYWKKVKHDGWGDKLHEFIKANSEEAGMHVRTPYNLAVLLVCKYNQRIAMLRRKFKREEKYPQLVVLAMTVEPYMRAEGLHALQQCPWFMNSSQPIVHAQCFTNIP